MVARASVCKQGSFLLDNFGEFKKRVKVIHRESVALYAARHERNATKPVEMTGKSQNSGAQRL